MAPQNFSDAYENKKNLEFRTQVYMIRPRNPLSKEYKGSGFALEGYKVYGENIPKIWLG